MAAAVVSRKPTVSWLDLVQKYINTLNHMLIALVTVYSTWVFIQYGPATYSLHMWLCMIGYQLLMCESIMSLYQHNSWSGLHSRRTQTHLHWILQALGSGCAIAGMIVFYVARERHFVTTHSQLGLASGIFTVIGVLNGTSALWARELFRWVKPVYTKLFHNICGILAFTLGMASLIYGFNKSIFKTVTSAEAIVGLQVVCGLTILMSLVGAGQSLWRLVQGALPALFYREEEEDEADEVVEPKTHKDNGKLASA